MTLSDKLKQIAERCEKATAGPWRSDSDCDVFADHIIDNPETGEPYRVAALYYSNHAALDSNFIANSRQDIPMLLDVVRIYERALKQTVEDQCCACGAESGSDESDKNVVCPAHEALEQAEKRAWG